MSLIQHWEEPDKHQEIAFWKIEEPLSFFTSKIQEINMPTFRSEKRALEFAATRYLLKVLRPDFPFSSIVFNEKGKPYLKDRSLFFSISHSFPYVGVGFNNVQPIGIDLQTFEPKILRLKDRFLSEEEQSFTQAQIDRTTLLWASKEAAYKWYGEGFMDFIDHMTVVDWREEEENIALSMEFKHPKIQKQLNVKGKIEDYFAWAITSATI